MQVTFYTPTLDLKTESLLLANFLEQHPDFEFERLLGELIRTGHGPGNSAMMLEYALVGYLARRRTHSADFPMFQVRLSREDRQLIEARHAQLSQPQLSRQTTEAGKSP